jgi:large subunit ribosomal protein L18
MNKITAKARSRKRRVLRVRSQLRSGYGTRLTVHSTGRHIYAQVIDDAAGVTVASASSCEAAVSKLFKSGGNVEAATVVGRIVAERALAAGVVSVVFDRGARRFHGRVAAVADSARDGGLKF